MTEVETITISDDEENEFGFPLDVVTVSWTESSVSLETITLSK